MASETSRPATYWNGRLSERFDACGAGDLAFGERYNRWLYRAKRRRIEALLGRRSLADALVLDVGCGTGFFVEWFLGRGAHVEGLDVARVSVERLSERYPTAGFTRCNIAARRFPTLGTFHIVNAWDVLYHIVDDEAFERALANIAGCCDEGSELILTDRLGSTADEQVAPQVKYRCLATYDRLLERLGFESVRTLPLHSRLNRADSSPRIQRTAAPVLFALDRFARQLPPDNLSVGVWRYAVPKVASAEPDAMWPMAS